MATLVYYRQMDYVRTKDLGYNPQLVIRSSLVGDRDYAQIRSFLQNEISGEPAIAAISFTDNANNAVRNTKINDRLFGALHRQADEHYLPLLEIPLKAGRNFSTAFSTDKTRSVIVNETFMKAAGLEDPIGAQVFTNEPFNGEAKNDYRRGQRLSHRILAGTHSAHDDVHRRLDRRRHPRKISKVKTERSHGGMGKGFQKGNPQPAIPGSFPG